MAYHEEIGLQTKAREDRPNTTDLPPSRGRHIPLLFTVPREAYTTRECLPRVICSPRNLAPYTPAAAVSTHSNRIESVGETEREQEEGERYALYKII